MKILVECQWPIESGSVFSYGFAKGLKENGHDVFCVLSGKMENKDQWIETFGLDKLFFIQTTPSRKNPVASSISFYRDCLKLRQKFKEIIFDLTVVTFLLRFDLTILKYVQSRKTAVICHDPVPHSNMPPKLVREYDRNFQKFDDIIVLTKSFIPLVEGRYKKSHEHVHFMRHGLISYPKSEKHDTSSATDDSYNFLFFGRILDYKGLHLLAEAYQQVSRSFPNVSLTIAGSGNFSEYEDEYRSLPNVRVVNQYIENEEIDLYFIRGKTIVVLPYIDATQSGVIPIAFDFEVPVIASDTGGLVEQLFDGQYGILFECGSSSSLAEAMMEFLKFPEKYEQEAQKMRTGRELLEWKTVTGDLFDHWRFS